MIIKLKEIGEIEIERATLTEDDEILLTYQTIPKALYRITYLEIEYIILTEYDGKWSMVIKYRLDENQKFEYDENTVLDIENQSDIYRLKALL